MKLKIALIIGIFALLTPSLAGAQYYSYYGRTPNLSVSRQGNYDSALVAVSNGNPNSQINFYYRKLGETFWSTVISNIGMTDYNGYFSQTVSLGSEWGSNNIEQYVDIGGISSGVITTYSGGTSCSYYGCNIGGLTLNPANLNLNAGQSATVSISSGVNLSAYPPYISSNSNSSVASASVNNYQLTVYGNTAGSTTITVCVSGGSTCGSVYVTVGSGSIVGGITFSENNFTMAAGQSKQVTVGQAIYPAPVFYVSSNSNPNAVTAYISGNTISLYAQNSGSATIVVCRNSGACANLYVTVSGTTNSAITFSDTNLSLNVGQSRAVNIYSNISGSFYISNNSNSSVVDATIFGSVLNLYGRTNGSATIAVCQYNNSQCGYLYVNVSGYGYGGNFYLSPSNINVNVGQTATVNANFSYVASGNLYLSSNSNPSIATVSFSGSTIYVYGQNSGATTMSICYNSQCNNLYVTVGGYSSGSLSFSGTYLPQPVIGQYYSQQLAAVGGSAPYNYFIQSGNLPAGLSLNNNGQIFGTPQNTVSSTFVVKVTDNYGRTTAASFTLTPSSGSVLGYTLYNNGALISEYGTVYIVYKNTKSGFTSSWVFQNLGFSFNNVVAVGNSGLIDSGYTVNTAYSSHPWGSWIKSGRTVYFVHEQGLIPVPSGDVFLNNGGSWNLVVNANRYDFERPILPVMDYNDSRLR
ncbi:MAG: Ig domain-containing protein [Candidatus Doudnabacteria bacterium]|nr:Ig domain-containing protein [Candidatus Doudnabacteria bacterium]